MKIQLKRSSVLDGSTAKAPLADQLEYGELAVNYNSNDPSIFLKSSTNEVIKLIGEGSSADSQTAIVPETIAPPSNPEVGALWFNPQEGRLFIYYQDVDSSQWIDASPDDYDPNILPDIEKEELQIGTIDDRYLMLNCLNGPLTGDLKIQGGGLDVDGSIAGANGAAIVGTTNLGTVNVSSTLTVTGAATCNTATTTGSGSTTLTTKGYVDQQIAANSGGGPSGDLDGTYLRLDASNGPVTGALTFDKQGLFKTGVGIGTDGDISSVPTGVFSDTDGNIILSKGGRSLLFTQSASCTRNFDAYTPSSTGAMYGFDVRGLFKNTTNVTCFNITPRSGNSSNNEVFGFRFQTGYSGPIGLRLVGIGMNIDSGSNSGGSGHVLQYLASGNAGSHWGSAWKQWKYTASNYNGQGPKNRTSDGTCIDYGNTSGLIVTYKSSSDTAPCIRCQRGGSASNRRLIDFVSGNGTTVGTITTDGSTTKYNTSSDYRLKENVSAITGAANAVKSLNPVTFEYIADTSNTVHQGFLAHELATVVAQAVTGDKDATEIVGDLVRFGGGEIDNDVPQPNPMPEDSTWTATSTVPVHQMVDLSRVVPLLSAALKELIIRVETLESA